MQKVRRFLWIVGVAVLWPSMAVGGTCGQFTWHHPPGMIIPPVLEKGQAAIQAGFILEGRDLFSTYLQDHEEGLFAEGTRWALASLPDSADEPGKEFLKQIERLQTMKVKQLDSVYAPWALCTMGELYWNAKWYSEANAVFEEFLESYPEHPLAGAVMVEAGLGYLENKQFLEAALVLRRVVEEPKWEANRYRGALGLADATAMSKAWKQAYYWYRVVEAEKPELIRQSERSSYYYGLTELAVGDSRKAIPRLLTTVNLHPQHEISGQALNRISERLNQEEHEFLSLWFAEQASQSFKGQESSRRGKAAQIRWVVNFLSHEHSKEEWSDVYRRLDDLEIYISLSWDNVVEMARPLTQAPEQDLAEESLLWMGRGYLELHDFQAAIKAFMHLASITKSDTWRQEAERHLSSILDQQFQVFYDQQEWVKALKFYENNKKAFSLVPLTRERIRNVAQAYQQVNLPATALQWYEQLLEEYPDSPLREEIFAQKVFLADDQQNTKLLRESGELYLQEYSNGLWSSDVLTLLGLEALERKDFPLAVQEFSGAVPLIEDKTRRRFVLRKRAQTYQEAGKRDLALQDLRGVVALNPQDMTDVLRLGDFLFDQGDFSDAELSYERVLSSKAPVDLKAWAKYRLALSMEYQGRELEARKLLAEVGQLETRSPEFENTIRAAAVAVLDEFSLNGKPQAMKADEGS